VRTGRDAKGQARVWYDFDEIEQIAASALHTARQWPRPEQPRVQIDDLLENYLGATVDYAGALDASILGYTEFRNTPHVVISRTLTDLATAEGASLGLRGRWRATLAHEAAHILLHAPWFSAASSNREVVRCHRETIEVPSDRYDWVEVQANMGMVALLMPRSPFLDEARLLLAEAGPTFPPLDPESEPVTKLIDSLAEAFETSHQATRRRLVTFGFVAGQPASAS
jgi:hypothetical protein